MLEDGLAKGELIMAVETPTTDQLAGSRLLTGAVVETERRQVDLRGLTITTAIVFAGQEELAGLAVGDELELLVEPFPAIVPDLEAWCRATGHELVETLRESESWRLRLRKGEPRRNGHRVAVVVSEDGLEELLSPLGFALAAALGGAQVALYLQGPAVRVLAPGFRPALARAHTAVQPLRPSGAGEGGARGANGEVAAAAGARRPPVRLRPLASALPRRPAAVRVCEYLTFMEIMQQADVQLYA